MGRLQPYKGLESYGTGAFDGIQLVTEHTFDARVQARNAQGL